MSLPRFTVEPHPEDGDFQHRCTSFPLQLQAVKYNRRTRQIDLVDIRARYQTRSRHEMHLCLGNALDGDADIQVCGNVMVATSTRQFALFSNDFWVSNGANTNKSALTFHSRKEL